MCINRLRDHQQHGATTVEMAIVLPLFLMIIFGIIEFSIMLYDKAMVTNAAREGSRFAGLWAPTIDDDSYKYTCGQINGVINNWLSNNLISFSNSDVPNITISQTDSSNAITTCSSSSQILCNKSDDIIIISIEYHYTFLIPYFFDKSNKGIPLTSVSRMKCEH